MRTPFDLDNKESYEEDDSYREIDTLSDGLSSTDDSWED